MQERSGRTRDQQPALMVAEGGEGVGTVGMFLAGLAVGIAIVNSAYGIFFYWESREKRKRRKDGSNDSSNRH